MAYQIPRVNPGDAFKASPAFQNRVAEVLNALPRPPENPAPRSYGQGRSSGIVLVQNTSEVPVACGEVLGIDAPAILPDADTTNPDASLNEFLSEVLLWGVAPTVAHAGRFVVAIEPIPVGRFGKCQVSGIVPVRLTVIDPADKWADVQAGSSLLSTGSTGPARVLWLEDNENPVRWGLVLIAGGPQGMFPVRVTKDGGSDGTVGTPASWTYTASDLAGTTLGTAVVLSRARPNGSMQPPGAGTYGVGFFDGGDFVLWDAGEVPSSGACATT